MKKFAILFAIILIALMVFAERPIWSQYDWTGGAGQNLMVDSTMYLEALGVAPSNPLSLDYLNDTNWVMMSSYPPVPLQSVNKIIANGDTTIICTGLTGLVSYSTNLGGAWIQLDTLPINQSTVELFDLDYIDGILYVSGYYGGINKGIVFRSFDFQTWDTMTVQPITIVDRVYAITKMSGNEFIGVAGNPDPATMNMDGIIMKSYDACSTWTKFDTVGFAVCAAIEKINDSIAIVGRDFYLDAFCASITYDAGETWIPTLNPLAWEIVTALCYDEIGTEVYFGDWAGQLAKANIATIGTWTPLDTNDMIPDTLMITGISFVDTVMYITASMPGNLYRSYDGGYTVELAQEIADKQIISLCQIAPHTFAMGSSDSFNGGRVYYTSYYKSGYMTSSIFALDGFFDPISAAIAYTTPIYLQYWASSPRFTSMSLKVRTGDSLDMSDALDWLSCTNVGNSGVAIDVSSIASIDAEQMYMQYRVDFTTSKNELTPYMDSIIIFGDYLGIEDLQIFDGDVSYNRISSSMMSMDYNGSSDMPITIYDMSGRMVYNGILKPGKNILNTNCVQGKYIVKFNNSKDNIIILK